MSHHAAIVAHHVARQQRADARARAAAGRVDSLVRHTWRLILRALPARPTFAGGLPDLVGRIFARLNRTLPDHLATELAGLADWGYRTAAGILRRRLDGTLTVRPVPGPPPAARPGAGAPQTTLPVAPLLPPPPPGGVRAPRTASPGGPGYVLPPLPVARVKKLVGPAPEKLTAAADPQRAAAVVWQGISDGKNRIEIAKDLKPVVEDVGAAARRVTRTEGLRVATAAQLTASEQIPDLVIGYQVLSVGDARVRPEHTKRHGTVYYRNPRPGELGFDVMPQPPIDQPGNRLAHNCRCILVPVFDRSDTRIPDDLTRLVESVTPWAAW